MRIGFDATEPGGGASSRCSSLQLARPPQLPHNPPMIGLNVRADLNAARRALATLKGQAEKAAGRSLDRVATTVRKYAADDIANRLALPKGPLKARISKRRGGELRFIIEAVGGPVPLRDYTARTTRKGVTYRVKRGGPRKLYRRQGKTAFVVPQFGSHVFVRVGTDPKGKARARVRKVWGPGVTHYFRRGKLLAAMTALAAERWRIEFDREIRFRAARAGITIR